MLSRIFGGTEEDQLRFLQIRSIITLVALVIAGVCAPFIPEASIVLTSVIVLIWGWSVIKNWFGITTLGAIFSGNVVIGVLLFVLYLFAAYIVGIFFALIGIFRWLYLKIKMRKKDS